MEQMLNPDKKVGDLEGREMSCTRLRMDLGNMTPKEAEQNRTNWPIMGCWHGERILEMVPR